jgi:hypothetical protein
METVAKRGVYEPALKLAGLREGSRKISQGLNQIRENRLFGI